LDCSIANLRDKIVEAFASVARPGRDEITGHKCEECDELMNTFSSLEANAVPPQIVDSTFDQLPLFTPEAYRYFLPAYLLKCLDDFDPDNSVCEFVIYSLTPQAANETDKLWIDKMHGPFDRKQKDAVAAFLELVLASEKFKHFHSEAEFGLRAHWTPHPDELI
jgi:hypothetical protein